MGSIDDFLDAVEPRTVTVNVPVRGDLVQEIRDVSQELGRAIREDELHNLPSRAPELQARLEQLNADLEADGVLFKFVGLSNREWSELLAAHPPSVEDRALGADYNPATFPVAAIAASCVEPEGVTPDKVEALADTVTLGVFRRLWDACLAANIGVEDQAVPTTAAAIDGLLASVVSSTTAADTESPTASSPAE